MDDGCDVFVAPERTAGHDDGPDLTGGLLQQDLDLALARLAYYEAKLDWVSLKAECADGRVQTEGLVGVSVGAAAFGGLAAPPAEPWLRTDTVVSLQAAGMMASKALLFYIFDKAESEAEELAEEMPPPEEHVAPKFCAGEAVGIAAALLWSGSNVPDDISTAAHGPDGVPGAADAPDGVSGAADAPGVI